MSAESVTPAILFTLTPEAARVMGCLIEKEITLPDYYPMTLNALVTACTQTTNRDPIVRYDERTVLRALESMKTHGYVFEVNIVGGRTLKYRHNLKGKLQGLERPHMALLCMLMLRGSQTAGELRQRTERLFEFPDMPSVENALAELIGYNEGPLVQCIPQARGSAWRSSCICSVARWQAQRPPLSPLMHRRRRWWKTHLMLTGVRRWRRRSPC